MIDEMHVESAEDYFLQQSSRLQQNHADGGITAGFGSLDSSAYTGAGVGAGFLNTNRSQQPFDQIESLGRENASSGTVGFIHPLQVDYQDSTQNPPQQNFGSMIYGKPCLE